jgi:hypothetical protein
MDLNMPVLNGFDGCEKINKFFDEADREVKVTYAGLEGFIDIMELKPVIVACTSESICNDIL